MFDLLKLYDILKPKENPEAYTKYPLILGGSDTTISLERGAWVLNVLNSKAITKPDIFMIRQGEGFFEYQRRIITTDYQIDFYKAFDNAVDFEFIPQNEAVKMQGWLNSPIIGSALFAIDAEIKPVQGSINYTTELSLNKAVLNRASFDFSIISYEKVGWVSDRLEKIKLEGEYIDAKIFKH